MQLLNIARGLKFQIQKVEGLDYPCSENKASQLSHIVPFFFGVLVPFSDVVEPLSLFSLEESSPPESLLDWLLDEA